MKRKLNGLDRAAQLVIERVDRQQPRLLIVIENGCVVHLASTIPIEVTTLDCDARDCGEPQTSYYGTREIESAECVDAEGFESNLDELLREEDRS